jgi:hypothetical protein
MTRSIADFAPRRAIRRSATVIAAAIFLAICATGIAAFVGLLPKSDGVATSVTATPLVEMQATLMDLFEPGASDTPATPDEARTQTWR